MSQSGINKYKRFLKKEHKKIVEDFMLAIKSYPIFKRIKFALSIILNVK